MNNTNEYLILKDKSLIIEYYNGKFSVDELIEFKNTVFSDKDYNPKFNIIHDFREIEFLFEIEEISKYVKIISDNRNYIANRTSTMITKTPNQVVTSMGFEMIKGNLPIQVIVCSTIETIFSLIGLPNKDWKTIESLIRKFNNLS